MEPRNEPLGTLEAPIFLTTTELEAGIGDVRRSPSDAGRVELIVVRPDIAERESVATALLTPGGGVVGDSWSRRPARSTPDGSPDPLRQVTIMNARFARLLAGGIISRLVAAGDQLYIDLDISIDNMPPGTQLTVGEAVIELTEPPHLGCAKFVTRFGKDAMRFANSPIGRELRLRGAHTRVVTQGHVCVGDIVTKLR